MTTVLAGPVVVSILRLSERLARWNSLGLLQPGPASTEMLFMPTFRFSQLKDSFGVADPSICTGRKVE